MLRYECVEHVSPYGRYKLSSIDWWRLYNNNENIFPTLTGTTSEEMLTEFNDKEYNLCLWNMAVQSTVQTL